jgi:hypothetical protein
LFIDLASIHFLNALFKVLGWDSAVGKVTRYELNGPGSNPGGDNDIFRTRPDWPWNPPRLLHTGDRVFPGTKAAGACH